MRELVEKYDIEHFHVEYNDIENTFDVYKKLKRVLVEYSVVRVREGYWAVSFKIENWNGQHVYIHHRERDFGWNSVSLCPTYVTTGAHVYVTLKEPAPLYICSDARDRWSTPVIFNREQRDKLRELVEYLEDRLNEK